MSIQSKEIQKTCQTDPFPSNVLALRAQTVDCSTPVLAKMDHCDSKRLPVHSSAATLTPRLLNEDKNLKFEVNIRSFGADDKQNNQLQTVNPPPPP
ncbi:hypothetical protein BgiMline_018329 [Biomphalaria glabrata]